MAKTKSTAKPAPDSADPADQEMFEALGAELSLAGEIIEKAISHLKERNVDDMAIASALLGGALSLLAECVTDEGIITILEQAIESVENGELRAGTNNQAP